MLPTSARWVCVCVLVSVAATARAQANGPLLVLQESPNPHKGLLSALRIQLLNVAVVRAQDWSPTGTLAERIGRATALGAKQRALAVVWTEPPVRSPDGALEAVLYLVGRSHERALLEVVRVPGGRGPDLDRTLALKVGEVIEELQRSPSSVPSASLLHGPPAPPAPAPPTAADAKQPEPTTTPETSPPPVAPVPKSGWGTVLLAGARAKTALISGWTRWGVGAAAGPTLQLPALALAVRLGVDWFPSATLSRAGSRVSIAELAPLIIGSAQWRTQRWLWGPRVGAALDLLSASGETAQGHSGSAARQTFAWSVGFGLQCALAQGFGVAAQVDVQLAAVHERFEVNSATLVDLGHVLLVGGVEFDWHPP